MASIAAQLAPLRANFQQWCTGRAVDESAAYLSPLSAAQQTLPNSKSSWPVPRAVTLFCSPELCSVEQAGQWVIRHNLSRLSGIDSIWPPRSAVGWVSYGLSGTSFESHKCRCPLRCKASAYVENECLKQEWGTALTLMRKCSILAW